MKFVSPESWAQVAAALSGGLLVCSLGAAWFGYVPVRSLSLPEFAAPQEMAMEEAPDLPVADAIRWREVEGRRPLFPSAGPDSGAGVPRGLAQPGGGGEELETAPTVTRVRMESPPLHLAGQVGAAPVLRGIFVVTSTGETVVAGEGWKFPGLGLVVERITLTRPSAAEPVRDSVIEAWIRDVHSGRVQRLASGGLEATAGHVATVRLGRDGEEVELRTGDVISHSGREWRVRTILAGEPAVELEDGNGRVLRLSPDPGAGPGVRTSRPDN